MFSLRATMSDGFSVSLPGTYASQSHAERAAQTYMRDYSDPCGLGVHVAYVSIIDQNLQKGSPQ